jgi:hypothetical protein
MGKLRNNNHDPFRTATLVWMAGGEFIPQAFGPLYLACLFAFAFLLWRFSEMFKKK